MTKNNAASRVLTDEEIQDAADGFDIYGAKPEFARAIEQAVLSKLRAPVDDERVDTVNSEPLPVVARLYYGGSPQRRYRRASTQAGPGEPLCFVSVAEAWLRRKDARIAALEKELVAALASAPVADDLVASLHSMASVAPTGECEILLAAASALASAPVTHYECGRSNGDGTYAAVPVRAPVADERAAQEYGSPADVAQRIEQYLAHDGRMNSGTQLLYEAMKALRGLAREAK